jgi:hypothetical protein
MSSSTTTPLFEIPNFDCPGTILPTRENLHKIFTSLANIPSKIRVLVAQLNEQVRQAIRAGQSQIVAQLNTQIASLMAELTKILGFIKAIQDLISKVVNTVQDPILSTIRAPEIEWERRSAELIKEFHLWVQVKILQLVSKLVPINFVVSVIGISIDLVKFVTDPSYVSSLKNQITGSVGSFIKLVDEKYQYYYDKIVNFQVPELQAESVIQYIKAKLTELANDLMTGGMGILIKMFKKIWKVLGLPAIPDITSIKEAIRSVVDSVWNSLKGQPKKLIDALLDLPLFAGITVRQLIGNIDDIISSPERTLARILDAINDFAVHYPKYILMQWMSIIMKFLKRIGLGAILKWILFTFCTFLNLVGIPALISGALSGISSLLKKDSRPAPVSLAPLPPTTPPDLEYSETEDYGTTAALDYSGTEDYEEGSIVLYLGATFEAVQDVNQSTIGEQLPNPSAPTSYWAEVDPVDTSDFQFEVVTYQGAYYQSLQPVLQDEGDDPHPPTDPDYWVQIDPSSMVTSKD